MTRASVSRRAVLGSIAAVSVTGTALASGTADRRAESNAGPCERPPVPAAVANRPDAYLATVDRVVDGAHVVILLEDGEQVIDQFVVPAAEYPCLDERDGLIVVVEDGEPTWIRYRRDGKPDSRGQSGTGDGCSVGQR